MRYLDVCAGISASTVAWKPLGWTAAAYSEIEAAPRAVLSHHYPDVPLHGDFTTIRGDEYGPVDLLVGGTPCQDFSVAGLRKGLAGDRGNLTLEFIRLADRVRPRWVVWENVPGVLSIDGGRAFGAFLGGLGQLGYGFAYRVLDAQHFGVPQRRRRVFVVGCAGDWRRAAAVLLERHSLSGHPAPRREARESVAGSLSASTGRRGGVDDPERGGLIAADIAAILLAGGNTTGGNRQPGMSAETAATMLVAKCLTAPRTGAGGSYLADPESETLIAHALRGEGFDASEDGTGRGTPLVPVAHRHSGNCGSWETGNRTDALTSANNSAAQHTVMFGSAVRRLTPRECERLQGFPDDYTLVLHRGKPMANGPRYKALGNSMAVPVMRWIGERIEAVESLTTSRLAA